MGDTRERKYRKISSNQKKICCSRFDNLYYFKNTYAHENHQIIVKNRENYQFVFGRTNRVSLYCTLWHIENLFWRHVSVCCRKWWYMCITIPVLTVWILHTHTHMEKKYHFIFLIFTILRLLYEYSISITDIDRRSTVIFKFLIIFFF